MKSKNVLLLGIMLFLLCSCTATISSGRLTVDFNGNVTTNISSSYNNSFEFEIKSDSQKIIAEFSISKKGMSEKKIKESLTLWLLKELNLEGSEWYIVTSSGYTDRNGIFHFTIKLTPLNGATISNIIIVD